MTVLKAFSHAKLSFLILVVTGLICVPFVSGLGVFEIKILSLEARHEPCDELRAKDIQCKGESSCTDATLIIDACLSHHQLHPVTPLPCTLGQTFITVNYTDVMDWNVSNKHVLLIPFSYSWPGGFTLSVRIRKQCPGQEGKGNLLSKFILKDIINPSLQWRTFLKTEASFHHPPMRMLPFETFPTHSASSTSTSRPISKTWSGKFEQEIDARATSLHASMGTSKASERLFRSTPTQSVLPLLTLHGNPSARSGTKRSGKLNDELKPEQGLQSTPSHAGLKEKLFTERSHFMLNSVSAKPKSVFNKQYSDPSIRQEQIQTEAAFVRHDGLVTKGTVVTSEGERKDVLVAVRILCEEHYYGRSCSRLCRSRNDFLGHFRCTSNGNRACLHGWRGENCTEAICSKRCPSFKGTCIKPNTCLCKHGWFGESCDKCRTRLGCKHGTCQLPGQCLCHPGWMGPLCDVEELFCLDHKPCQNGGTCFHDPVHNYTCSCLNGYTGTHCEVPMCHKHFCLHGGHCQVADGTRYCLCPTSYTGPRCQRHHHQTAKCKGFPCSNPPSVSSCVGSECRFQGHVSSKVACSGGFCSNAAEPSDFCKDHVCYNNGTCSVSPNSNINVCVCPFPFAGDYCLQIRNPCHSNPCLNNGVCSTSEDDREIFKCSCSDGYSGKLCDSKIVAVQTKTNACNKEIVCKNKGKCKQSRRNGRYYCECVGDFTGEFCEIDNTDPCAVHTCLNGGKCVLEINNKPLCICKSGYTGTLCQNLEDICARVVCLHGGTCIEHDDEFVCICRNRFEGQFCQKKISSRKTVSSVSSMTIPKSSADNKNVNLVQMSAAIFVLISNSILVYAIFT